MNLLKVAFMAKILQKTFCYKTLNFTTDDSKKIHKRFKCLRNIYKLNQILQNNVFVKTNLYKSVINTFIMYEIRYRLAY